MIQEVVVHVLGGFNASTMLKRSFMKNRTAFILNVYVELCAFRAATVSDGTVVC